MFINGKWMNEPEIIALISQLTADKKRLEKQLEQTMKRGEWKYYKNNGIINTYICTNCQGKVEMAIDVEPSSFKYCPFCGADMRGDESNA